MRGFDDLGQTPAYVTDLSASDREFSYNAAFIWKPSENSSVYLAYGTSFEPAGPRRGRAPFRTAATVPPVTAAALNADPERSDAWELGGRVQLLDDNVTLSGRALPDQP